MKKLLCFLFALLALVGCAKNNAPMDGPSDEPVVDENPYNLVTPGKLTLSMSTDFAPLEFVDLTKEGQEKYCGSDVELAKYIANALGLELEIKAMEFDASQAAVANHLVDISISGYSYTANRAASYLLSINYSDDEYDPQVIMVAKKDEAKYTTLASINNADFQIAAQNGALQQDLVKEQLPNAELKAIDDLNAVYDLLAGGTYDGVAVAGEVADTIVAANPDKFVVVLEQFDATKYTGNHALMNIENTALCEAVDKAIASLPEGQYTKWTEEGQALFLSLGDNAAEAIVAEQE